MWCRDISILHKQKLQQIKLSNLGVMKGLKLRREQEQPCFEVIIKWFYSCTVSATKSYWFYCDYKANIPINLSTHVLPHLMGLKHNLSVRGAFNLCPNDSSSDLISLKLYTSPLKEIKTLKNASVELRFS